MELDYGRAIERPLVSFFNAVYAWMAVGLAVTATVGYMVAQSSTALHVIYGNKFVNVMFALGAVLIATAARKVAFSISAAAATGLFLLYAAVLGALLSGIYIVYDLKTLGAAFMVTGGVFGAMSLYGFVTKRDLTTIGSYAVMAVLGLFVASLVNVWMNSDMLGWIITYAVLAVFIVITAYRTQELKQMAQSMQVQENPDMAARVAIVGSLMLYVAFINLFMSILRIMGSRK